MRSTMFAVLLLLFSQSAAAGVTPWQAFEIKDGHITIPVEVNGVAGEAILDSGAELNMLGTAYTYKHGDTLRTRGKVRVQGVFGTETKPLYQDIQVQMFGTDLELDDLASGNIGKAKLLLGNGFFRAFIVQIDYPNQRMRLLTRDALEMAEFKNIPMRGEKDTSLTAVKVEVDEQQRDGLWLTLDTGNTGGLFINRSVAEARGWLDKYPLTASTAFGVNGISSIETFLLPYLKFGPYVLENVRVSVPAEGVKSNVGKRSSNNSIYRKWGASSRGLVGFDVLKHFVLTIDYKRHRMHVGLPE